MCADRDGGCHPVLEHAHRHAAAADASLRLDPDELSLADLVRMSAGGACDAAPTRGGGGVVGLGNLLFCTAPGCF